MPAPHHAATLPSGVTRFPHSSPSLRSSSCALLRAFFSPVEDFLQRGKVIVDSRFPWHVPLYRWLLVQCFLLAFVLLLSYRVGQGHGPRGGWRLSRGRWWITLCGGVSGI
jgi:hypothetical protein